MADKKESRAEEMAVTQEVKAATSVDWNNVFNSIVTGKKIEPGKTKHAAGGLLEPEPISMDLDAFASSQASAMGYKTASVDPKVKNTDVTPILYEINRYKFSSVNTQKDVEETAVVIRDALRKRMAQKILHNTKSLISYASDFYQSPEGIRVVFNILGNKYSMKTMGEFCGEEYLYCSAQGDQIVGGVFLKDMEGEFYDVSKNFKIEIKKT